MDQFVLSSKQIQYQIARKLLQLHLLGLHNRIPSSPSLRARPILQKNPNPGPTRHSRQFRQPLRHLAHKPLTRPNLHVSPLRPVQLSNIPLITDHSRLIRVQDECGVGLGVPDLGCSGRGVLGCGGGQDDGLVFVLVADLGHGGLQCCYCGG